MSHQHASTFPHAVEFQPAMLALLASMKGAETHADLAALRPHLTANDIADIPGPIGQSPEVFAAIGAQIAELLPPILEVCRRSLRA